MERDTIERDESAVTVTVKPKLATMVLMFHFTSGPICGIDVMRLTYALELLRV